MGNLSTEHTTKRKRAELYRKAARMVEQSGALNGGYTCHAILHAEFPRRFYTRSGETAAIAAYEDVYMEDARRYGNLGFVQAWMLNVSEDDEEVRCARILALCFMAAMVEAGDA